MYFNRAVVSTTLLAFILSIDKAAGSLARGFNDDIDWLNMEDGQKIAKEENKPMMVLIHKSWCGACKQLKPHFTTSMDILKESKKFVMINIQDKEEDTLHNDYFKIGKYIPRIVFVEPNGKVRNDIKNDMGNEKYPYYYSDPDQVIDSMKRAHKQIVGSVHDNREL